MPHDRESPIGRDGTNDESLAAVTASLFARWRGGQESVAYDLFELHRSWIALLVDKLLGPRLRTKLEPDDIVQEVGIRFLSYEPTADDGAVDRLHGLFRKIALHVIGDQHRYFFEAEMRDGNEVPLLSDSNLGDDLPRDLIETPGAKAERRHEIALARVTFWFLPAEQRDLIAMRWWYDVAFGDLAVRFSCEEATLRMRHLRATQQFAEVMAKVRTAFGQLDPSEVELIERQANAALSTDSGVDSRVLARSRIERFAAFLEALRHVGRLIREKLVALPDSWPRSLLHGPPKPPTPS